MYLAAGCGRATRSEGALPIAEKDATGNGRTAVLGGDDDHIGNIFAVFVIAVAAHGWILDTDGHPKHGW